MEISEFPIAKGPIILLAIPLTLMLGIGIAFSMIEEMIWLR